MDFGMAAKSRFSLKGRLSHEVIRRARLARQPRPDGVKGPPLRLLLGELASRKRGMVLSRPASRPCRVLLLPGFASHPLRMRRMAKALGNAGHEVHDWGLGLNLGPTPQNLAFLLARVRQLAEHGDQPIALVGWSLGGIFAREIAHRLPDHVAKVITLGTPFSGDRRANNAWRAYQLITGHAVDAPPIASNFSAKPQVPTIAVWSPRDGIVAPRSAAGQRHERDRAVAIRCSHLGFATDRESIEEVLRQLDIDD